MHPTMSELVRHGAERASVRVVLAAGTLLVAIAWHGSAARADGGFSGTPTVPGVSLLSTTEESTPAGLTEALAASECSVTTLALLIASNWVAFIPGAPAAANAAFPSSLAAGTPFFVRCVTHPMPVAPIPPGTVTGRVLWNERPVSGVSVAVMDLHDFTSERFGSATTDPAGWFSVAGVPPGEQYIFAPAGFVAVAVEDPEGPAFWLSTVTPFVMAEDAGTMAPDTYICRDFDGSLLPAAGSEVQTPHPMLSWDPFLGAVDYAVRVIRSGASEFIFQRGDHDAKVTVLSVQVSVALPPGGYSWRVDAFNSAGHLIGCSLFPRAFTVVSAE